MAGISSLTPQQVALLQNSDLLIRQALLSARTTLTLMQRASVDYAAVTQAIYSTLDSGTLVPTNTGLAGAVPVTVDQIATMLGNFNTLLSLWNSPAVQQLHANFVGAANLNG